MAVVKGRYGSGPYYPEGYSSYADYLSDDNAESVYGLTWDTKPTPKPENQPTQEVQTEPEPETPTVDTVEAATASQFLDPGPPSDATPELTPAQAIENALNDFISGPMADLLSALSQPPPRAPVYAPTSFAIGNSQNAAGVRPNRSEAYKGGSSGRGVSKYRQQVMNPVMATMGIKV